MHRFGLLCNFQRLTLTESFRKRIFWELYKVKASLQICKTRSFTSPGQWFWHCIKEFVDRHWGKMHQLMLICQSQTFTLTESFTEGIFWGLYRVEASLQTCKIPSFTFTEQWLVHCIKERRLCWWKNAPILVTLQDAKIYTNLILFRENRLSTLLSRSKCQNMQETKFYF